jgi:hypothetical protein
MLYFLALGCLFQQEPQWSSPLFPLEAIRFVGNRRVDDALLLVQTGLRQGQVVDELAIVQAERRLRQLPFVVEVEAALSRGQAQGSFILSFKLVEESWFFGTSLLESASQGDAGPAEQWGELYLGLRWFFAARSFAYLAKPWRLLDSSFQQPYGNPIDLGIASYGFTPLDLHVNLQVQFSHGENGQTSTTGQNSLWQTERSPALGLNLARSISGSQWAYLRFSHFEVERQQELFLGDESQFEELTKLRSDDFRLGWLLDTLDHPAFPRQGHRLELSLARSRWDQQVETNRMDISSGEVLNEQIGSELAAEGITLKMARAFPVGLRMGMQVSATACAPWSSESAKESYQAGLGWNLRMRQNGSLEQARQWFLFSSLDHRSDPAWPRWDLVIGAVARNRWGQFSLQLRHSWAGQETTGVEIAP